MLINGAFELGPELPVATYGHCLVSVNTSHVFMSGGSTDVDLVDTNGGLTHNTFLYDRFRDEWTQMPEALWDKEVVYIQML